MLIHNSKIRICCNSNSNWSVWNYLFDVLDGSNDHMGLEQ